MTADVRQLEDMRQAAYGLGMGFARAAEAEDELDRKLRLFDAFHRSFASVRLSIALAMRLRREALAPARTEADRDEDEALADPPEPSVYRERDDERDRDRETASLPVLLRTLERVANDAQALMPQAAELPSLRELLDRVRPEPKPSPKPAPRPSSPSSGGALRTRLSGGTAALTLTPPPRPGLPGLPVASPRRSTGPPRR